MEKKYFNYLIGILFILFIINYFTNSKKYFISKETPIYYDKDPKFNRGVFASRCIKSSEKIELSPTLEIETTDKNLKNYIFSKNGKQYVAFGCGSMFNHSDNPNVDWAFNDNNDILFVANKNIKKGEQLFINYGIYYWINRKQDKIDV